MLLVEESYHYITVISITIHCLLWKGKQYLIWHKSGTVERCKTETCTKLIALKPPKHFEYTSSDKATVS